MLKMILDPMGGILSVFSFTPHQLSNDKLKLMSWFVLQRLTNDGHAILREIDVAHPAAKSMIELSRTQDEEVGDGTTSVIILGKALALTVHHSLFSDLSYLDVFVSWRDPCPLVASARTQHPPGRHHQGLFERPRLCPSNH